VLASVTKQNGAAMRRFVFVPTPTPMPAWYKGRYFKSVFLVVDS